MPESYRRWLSLDEIAAKVTQPLPAHPDYPGGCPWMAHGYCWKRLRDPCDRPGPAPEKCRRVA